MDVFRITSGTAVRWIKATFSFLNQRQIKLWICNLLVRLKVYHLKYSDVLSSCIAGWHMTAAGLECLLAQTCACRNGLICTVYYTLITVFPFKRNPRKLQKDLLGKPSECRTDWVQIWPILSYQQTTNLSLADKSVNVTKQANVDPICTGI